MTALISVLSIGAGSVDPAFEGGSIQSALATMTNPSVAEHTYTAELYLGVLKVATSGVIGPFSIPAGGTVTKTFTVTMPIVEGVYEVYLDIWSDGVLLAHYKATADVTISVSPAIDIGPITWV